MAGSTIGTNFKITTWGESHGTGIGVVIDGCPAGLSLCEEDIQTYLNRRKPGQSAFSTPVSYTHLDVYKRQFQPLQLLSFQLLQFLILY